MCICNWAWVGTEGTVPRSPTTAAPVSLSELALMAIQGVLHNQLKGQEKAQVWPSHDLQICIVCELHLNFLTVWSQAVCGYKLKKDSNCTAAMFRVGLERQQRQKIFPVGWVTSRALGRAHVEKWPKVRMCKDSGVVASGWPFTSGDRKRVWGSACWHCLALEL